MLPQRVREHLCKHADSAQPLTYQALATNLKLTPPNTIYQLTVALEHLVEEDAAAGLPLIAAMVISKSRGGLPAPGFFECAKRVGRFQGDPLSAEASVFFEAEFNSAVTFWRSSPPPQTPRNDW